MKVKVARIGKPHGIRGELTVQLFTDDPELRFSPGALLSVEAASETGRAAVPGGVLEVTRARWNKQILVVGFAQVPDRNTAEALRGSQLFAEGDSGAEDDDAWYEHELLDMEVLVIEGDHSETDENPAGFGDGHPMRRIGVISGLRTMPHQDLLEVTLDGDGREVDVPFVQEIVAEIDEETRWVLLTPPPGLLELGLDEAGDPGEGDR
ncbi:ribosome maturation factor RimM [Kocuria coralli]|uniref:Ribosome maturation factor RimM n=1 Tax=Kocuria coralli TaxID=1461025 RepID=A0A5J5L3Q1_9MICC|nr:ribosome maturation factor RimM [Kocuria coralli]KAA9395726.1 ribosome maturation factor RimM [Kocuria coralli]